MKKNNTAEKAVLGAEKITKALKESTEKSLRNIINEAIANVISENVEDTEDDSFVVNDVEPDETPVVSDVDDAEELGGKESAEGEENAEDAESEESSEEGEESAEDAESDKDEWSDLEQYKIGDDDYDFTGVDGDELLKVYNKLGDDDQIFVRKEDDGTYSVKDDETGAEFVIELNPEQLDAAKEEGEAEEDEPESDDELSVELDSEEPESDDNEIEIELDDEDELNEDDNLGYTDSYQKKDPIDGLNLKEPADSKTTIDADNGAPKGTEKPWAGKGDEKPFEEPVNECGAPAVEDANLEENDTVSQQPARKEVMTKHKQHRPNSGAEVLKVDSPRINESVKRIVEKAKAIQAENKQYRESLDKIKKSLYEAAVLNVNLGKLVDLLVNETTTKDEKKAILGRFNNVKTISEGKALYDTIKFELNESKKSTAPVVEKQFAASTLNESVIYSSNQTDPSLDLMNRMDNLYKK